MSKKPGQLESSALTAWTPAQQAALYHLHTLRQKELDEAAALKSDKEKEDKRARGIVEEEVKPETVRAGVLVDDLLKSWCPPVYEFLDIFATPHIALIAFVGLHALYWWTLPWYLHHLLTFPITYLIPITCTLFAIYAPTTENRALWQGRSSVYPFRADLYSRQAYWVELAILDYLELVVFRDSTRYLVWWPKIKAVCCIVLYSVVVEEKKDRRKPAYKLHVSVAALVAKTSLIWAIVKGAVKLIRNFLPDIAAEEKRGKEDDKGNTATEKDSKSTSEEKKRAAQRERAKAQAK